MTWRISDGRIDRLVVFAGIDGEAMPAGELVFQGHAKRLGIFTYAKSWIEAKRPPLVPVDLPVRTRGFDGAPHEAPLAFYDSIPDGWGLSILKRAFPAQEFGLAEQLAACGDERAGFLSCGPTPDRSERWIPDKRAALELAQGHETIDDLVAAAIAADKDEASPTQLRALFRTSADVGGARPKARIRHGGREWIVKVPAEGDRFDEPRIEALCLDIARTAKIGTPDFQVRRIAGHSALFVERFDRRDGKRLAYMSAATLLRQPYTDYRTDATYAELAAAARRAGIAPCEAELFRRMLINGFVNNTDDHLRNHAFIRDAGRWRLSPVFDVVATRAKFPVMRAAPDRDATCDPAAMFQTHGAFGLTRSDAEHIYADIVDAVARIDMFLDKYEVERRDREILREVAPRLFAPPALIPSRAGG